MERRYISYVRVSTKGQEVSGLGLDAQRAMIRRHLETSGGILVAEFQEAESGKRIANRPVLQAALARCKTESCVLLIAKLDRLARNVHFVSGLMESGVEFVACDMPTANRLTIHILAAVAEEEARMISARTKAALAMRRERGLPMGGAAYTGELTEAMREQRKKCGEQGNAERKRKACEFRLSVQPQIEAMHQSGCTLGEMVRRLNREGFRTSTGKPWGKTQIRRILERIT